MKISITSLAVTIAALLASSSTIASPAAFGNAKNDRFMDFFDTNKDNIVTMDEFNDASRNRFSKMDADGNNTVSESEFRGHIKSRRSEWRTKTYQMADQNGDGNVSKEEYINFKRQRAEQRFLKMDRNNDGIVSNEEFSASSSNRFIKKFGRHRGKRIFSKLDSNNDGQISRDESVNAWTNWFKRMDINQDHVVTADEVTTYRKNSLADQ